MTTPQCPHCDATRSLVAVQGQGKGVIEYECSCCNRVVFVNADGTIVWKRQVEKDVSGRQTYGD